MIQPRLRQLTLALVLLCASQTPAAILYVDLNSTNSTLPYTNWVTAATNIQDAVDAADAGDQVLVANGVYQTGARLAVDGAQHRVVVTNAIVLQSFNGPTLTTIDGGGAIRCVYLANGAVLSGFAVSNGRGGNGGGVFCASRNEAVVNCQVVSNSGFYGGGVCGGSVTNCTLTNNSAGGYGGGAYDCTLNACVIASNSAPSFRGGGAAWCALNNCVLADNSAGEGGGAYQSTLGTCVLRGNSGAWGGGASGCTLNNCLVTGNLAYNSNWEATAASLGGGTVFGNANNCTIVGNSVRKPPRSSSTYQGGGTCFTVLSNCIIYFNSGSATPNWSAGALTDCCTTPDAGPGNITNAPLFVDQTNGNLRLQANSPCINAGNNAAVVGGTDLDDNPRIRGGTVDIGAYEFQNPTSVISYAWLQQYGLLTDGTADLADRDNDGMNNWQEWICGTDPTNSLSVLKMLAPSNSLSGVTVNWQSVSGKMYYLQRGTNLVLPPGLVPLQSNIVGQAGLTSFTDTTATNTGSYFYRVGVQGSGG